jgi:endonuclease-3 related protein
MPDAPTDDRTQLTPMAMYEVLYAHLGDLEWWPADGPFQVMVGAVLTQRTAWRNVETALATMKEAGIVDMDSLLASDRQALETLIRPSGTYRQKAERLYALFRQVASRGNGSLDAFLDRPTEVMREDLMAVKGIGPETADSIILYAARRPVFVVDAYTRRILGRLDIDVQVSYDDLASWFTDGLPRDPALFNNYHAALVELAKGHCRPAPLCEGCPFGAVCPTGRGEKSP